MGVILLHCIYESHWPSRNSLCPSAALFHRSSAASSLVLGCVSGGRLSFSSPISTLDAPLLLFLGELSGRALRSPARARLLMTGPAHRQSCGCRLRAF